MGTFNKLLPTSALDKIKIHIKKSTLKKVENHWM